MPAQTKEAKDAQRLCNLEPGSPEYRARLENVKEEIAALAAEFERTLCTEGGISLEAFRALLQQYTIVQLRGAIDAHGPDFIAHLGRPSEQKPEDPRAPGWRWEWELRHDK